MTLLSYIKETISAAPKRSPKRQRKSAAPKRKPKRQPKPAGPKPAAH